MEPEQQALPDQTATGRTGPNGTGLNRIEPDWTQSHQMCLLKPNGSSGLTGWAQAGAAGARSI